MAVAPAVATIALLAAACGSGAMATPDGAPAPADAGTPDAAAPDATPAPPRALVVYNPDAPGSREVAEHYAAFRALPADRLCAVASPDVTTLDGATYDAWLAAVLACVSATGAAIETLVPVFGVPYKLAGRIRDGFAGAATPTTVSLDAVLAFGADGAALTAPTGNPLYRWGSSIAGTYDGYAPFAELRDELGIAFFLVARIDGADAAAAMALVDRTAAAEALAAAQALDGVVYVDGNRGLPHPASEPTGSYEWGEWNIIGVENVFAGLGWYPVVADYDGAEFGTAPAPLACPDALYYAGWYSFGNYNDVFTWRPGAIGGHLDSCSACDIRAGNDWSARALAAGITATFGAVNEPYVIGMPEYDQFFLYLTQGASFGEAAYESTMYGAWMMVWVGDPLYRPYPAQ